eukprot:1157065-Pelagomonas_calceolata.AAC.11
MRDMPGFRVVHAEQFMHLKHVHAGQSMCSRCRATHPGLARGAAPLIMIAERAQCHDGHEDWKVESALAHTFTRSSVGAAKAPADKLKSGSAGGDPRTAAAGELKCVFDRQLSFPCQTDHVLINLVALLHTAVSISTPPLEVPDAFTPMLHLENTNTTSEPVATQYSATRLAALSANSFWGHSVPHPPRIGCPLPPSQDCSHSNIPFAESWVFSQVLCQLRTPGTPVVGASMCCYPVAPARKGVLGHALLRTSAASASTHWLPRGTREWLRRRPHLTRHHHIRLARDADVER